MVLKGIWPEESQLASERRIVCGYRLLKKCSFPGCHVSVNRKHATGARFLRACGRINDCFHKESIGPYGISWGSNGLHGVSWGRLTGIEGCGRYCSLILWLKGYPVAQAPTLWTSDT